MNLMIVDDEIFAIQGILDSVDWKKMQFDKILTANTYAQAINLFLQEKVDIILCDIEMPFGSGLQLVEWVKSHDEEVECILLTCHGEFAFAKEAIKLRCFDYILKPAQTELLEETLLKAKQVLEKKRMNNNYLEYGKLYVDKIREETPVTENPDAIQTVKDYIKKNLSESLSVEALAGLVHLSPDYLTRAFKKECQITLIDYIIQQRMFLAKELLTTTDMSVTRVSDRTGYGNYSYFSKAFRKYYGMSPREMQQMNRKK